MLHPGEEFANLVVEGLLGEGSHSAVYRVRDNTSGERFALKIQSNDSMVATVRLKREAAVHARIVHPNVVPLIRLVTEGGRIGILLHLVEGPTLATLLQRGPMPPRLIEPLGEAIISAVAAVHGAGVLHRDLKPSNILMSGSAGRWTPMLADFGLATTPDLVSESSRDALYGTPAYMAPEVLRSPHNVDRRADVFALGAILYELAAGHPAFNANSESLFQDIAEGRFERPGRYAVLSRELENTIVGCLQPDLAWRIPDIETVIALWRGEPPQFAYALPPGALGNRSGPPRTYGAPDQTIIPDDEELIAVLAPSRPVPLEPEPSDPPAVEAAADPAPAPIEPTKEVVDVRREAVAAPARGRAWLIGVPLALVAVGLVVTCAGAGDWFPTAASGTVSEPVVEVAARALPVAAAEPAVASVAPAAAVVSSSVAAVAPAASTVVPVTPVEKVVVVKPPVEKVAVAAAPPVEKSNAKDSTVASSGQNAPGVSEPAASAPPMSTKATEPVTARVEAVVASKAQLKDLTVDVSGGVVHVRAKLGGDPPRALGYELSKPGGAEDYILKLAGTSNEVGIERIPVASGTVKELSIQSRDGALVIRLGGSGMLPEAVLSQSGDVIDLKVPATNPQ